MQQNNSLIVAEAFKKDYAACINGKGTNCYFIGDLSSSITSHELQIQWGLLPGYNLVITMERPNKFRASLISPQFQTVDQFVLKTQLEVMLEKVITPDRGNKVAFQPVVEMLVEMGFNEEVARLAAIEADNDIEKAVDYAIPISSKIRAENVLAIQANAGKIEKGLQAYYKARLEQLTSFCLLCDRIVENHDGGKSCVCSSSLCEWQFKQIGLVPTQALVQPRLVQGLPPAFKITSLSAGEDHSVACFENGDVYLWGNGKRGQLGDGTFQSFSSAMQLPHHKFSKAVAGNGFTLGLSANGDLWVWGTGIAELGLGQKEEMVVPRPTMIDVYCEREINRRIRFKEISVADRLCFAIAENDSLYAWGEHKRMSYYSPFMIPNLRVRSVTAHYLHPACVDDHGSIHIWTKMERNVRAYNCQCSSEFFVATKKLSHCIQLWKFIVCTNNTVHEYKLNREHDRYFLRHKMDHFDATRYAVGSDFVVLGQGGTVRVIGVGSGVMGYQETTVSPSGVEISQIRNARHIAAGPHHVVCAAMNDRIVHGQSEEDAARDVFVYQWGRDHSAHATVQCQSDIQRQQEQIRLANLAIEQKHNELMARTQQRIESGIDFSKVMPVASVNEKREVDDLDLPQEGPFESGEDLEKWNEQFLNSQQERQDKVQDQQHDEPAVEFNDVVEFLNSQQELQAKSQQDQQQQECEDKAPHEDSAVENNVVRDVELSEQQCEDKAPQDEPAVESNDNDEIDEVELTEQEKAVNVYLWCYHMCEQLNMTLDTDKSQLFVDLNHPVILLSKIANGESSRFKDLNIDVNTKDHDGDTALMLAMQENDYTHFTKVLDLDPELNVVNNKNEYPLDVAVSCGGSYSKAFVVALVEKGATKCSPKNQAAIVNVINSAAEFVPKLKEKLDLFSDE